MEAECDVACGAALRVVPLKHLWKEVQASAGTLLSLQRCTKASVCFVSIPDIVLTAAVGDARIIIRPSTLVRSNWADEGATLCAFSV